MSMDFHNWDLVGSNISRVRKLRRWTQKEVADRLDIHTSMITRWEKGQIHPKETQVAQIARALEVKSEELFLPLSEPIPSRSSAAGGDSDLSTLLEQVSSLDDSDKQALKAVIQAMVIKSRVCDAMGTAHLASRQTG